MDKTKDVNETTTKWERTYRATATVDPIQHIGGRDDCSAWCSSMIGSEVWVTDANGKQHIVGVVTRTELKNIDGI